MKNRQFKTSRDGEGNFVALEFRGPTEQIWLRICFDPPSVTTSPDMEWPEAAKLFWKELAKLSASLREPD